MKFESAVFTLTLVVIGRLLSKNKQLAAVVAPASSKLDGLSALPGSERRNMKKHSSENGGGSDSANHTSNNGEPDLDRALLERILVDTYAVQSIRLGDCVDLYVALNDASAASPDGDASLHDICNLAKTDPRLTYDWLQFQVKFRFASVRTTQEGEERFVLNERMAQYLLPPSRSSVSMIPSFKLATSMIDLTPVKRSFESGAQTLFTIDEPVDVKFDEDLSNAKTVENRIRAARETYCGRFFRNRFVDAVLAKINGGNKIINQLEMGEIDAAEVYCGATSGLLSITLAAQFPASRFFGFDFSNVSLTRARDLAHGADTKNARFYDVKERSLTFGPPPSQSKKRQVKPGFGLILTFMSMSMIDAETQISVFREAKQALDANGGLWIIMELDSEQDDLAYALCIGMSMLHFLPSLAAPQTCTAFTEKRCAQLAQLAGFSSMTRGPSVENEFLIRLNTFVLRV